MEQIGPDRKMNVYVFSLSAAEDQLSQWRAYCNGGGFALGFRKDLLVEIIRRKNLNIEACIYDSEEQKSLIHNAVDSISNSWIYSTGSWPEKDGEGPRFEIYINLIYALSSLSPKLKNPAFKEEQEFRIFSEPTSKYAKGVMKFRPQRGLVVPYREIKLEDDDLWRTARVVVGPSPHPEESRASVYQLLRCNTGYAPNIRITEASYREW